MPRYAKARDANEPEIRNALIRAISTIERIVNPKHRQLTVIRIDQPCDLLVGVQDRTVLLEVKNPASLGGRTGTGRNTVSAADRDTGGEFEGMDPRLTRSQARTHQAWRGSPIHIVETIADAMRACGICTCCQRRMAEVEATCRECHDSLASCEEVP